MRSDHSMSASLSVALFTATFAALLAGCTSAKECTLLGCQSSATIRTYANITRDQLATATISACRNDSCSSGQPTTVPAAPGDRLQVRLSGPVAVDGFISSPDPQKGYRVEAVFPLEGIATQNGDAYDLRITLQGQSQPTVSAADRATYQETQPNGPECPPVCRTATIEK